MPELKEQLQRTFGDNYSLERELGGGGMSRVFVAEELSLGRKSWASRRRSVPMSSRGYDPTWQASKGASGHWNTLRETTQSLSKASD